MSGIDHLRQSIVDILTTPIGSRVMLREYGSRLFELIDRPINPETVSDFIAATVEALRKWEPRFRVSNVEFVGVEAGKLQLNLSGVYLPTGEEIKLDGVIA